MPRHALKRSACLWALLLPLSCLHVANAGPAANPAEPTKTRAAAPSLLSEADTRKAAEKALDQFVLNRIDAGYKLLLPYWVQPAHELTSLIEQTERQWNTVAVRFGESLNYEHIATDRVGKSFVRHTYIQKLGQHALRWEFRFYKPKDKWVLNAVAFDDRVDALFADHATR